MKILEFDEFSQESNSELENSIKSDIREWVRKYEKYFNFHNSQSFIDSIGQVTQDCINQLGISPNKGFEVKKYLESLYNTSDGLSVIMSPTPEYNYNQIDQVQRFQY